MLPKNKYITRSEGLVEMGLSVVQVSFIFGEFIFSLLLIKKKKYITKDSNPYTLSIF
jgi:hypothetical protein